MGAESDALVGTIKEGAKVFSRKDDDIFDRLSNRYTVAFLVFCILFLASKTYVGEPIKCFTPKEFHDNWVSYTENYCWIKNTYFVHTNKPLPLPMDHSEFDATVDVRPEILYYQWVPIILALMIAVFGIPVGFWHVSMAMSGYDIEGIVKLTTKAENISPKERDPAVKFIANQLKRNIKFHRSTASGNRRVKVGNGFGLFLYLMYIVTKILYTLVPIILLLSLNTMMGEGYSDYGIRAARGIMRGDENYIQNPMFPRVSLCDYRVRKLAGNTHPYTVQCVLIVNLFNERIFLVIWWWLIILACLSFIGLVVFLTKTLFRAGNYDQIMKYLRLLDAASPKDYKDRELVTSFTNKFLRQDGVFCLRLIAKNVPDVVAAEIAVALYNAWLEDMNEKDIEEGAEPNIPNEETKLNSSKAD